MQQILTALGAGTNDVLAAFLGSICGAFMLTEPTARQVIATVVIGVCVGTYVGANVPAALHSNLFTFIIGSFGTVVLLYLQANVRRRFFDEKMK